MGTAGFGIVGSSGRVSGTFTRPANTTAYTAGDVVSDNGTTTTLLEMSGVGRREGSSGYITGAMIITDQKSITPRLQVKLYNASNPTVSADNAASRELYADVGKMAAIPFTLSAMSTATDTTNSTMSKSEDAMLRIPFQCASGTQSLYALVETLDAFTPTSGQSFTLVLFVDHD